MIPRSTKYILRNWLIGDISGDDKTIITTIAIRKNDLRHCSRFPTWYIYVRKKGRSATTLYYKCLWYQLFTFFWEWYIYTEKKVVYHSPNCINPDCCYQLYLYNQEMILHHSSSVESFITRKCTRDCDWDSFDLLTLVTSTVWGE